MNNNKPLIYSIEGNNLSGKTTLINKMKIYLELGTDLNIYYFNQNDNLYNKIIDENGKSLYVNYFSIEKKYTLQLLITMLTSKIELFKEILKNNYDIIFLEGSFLTEKNVLINTLYNEKKITNNDIKIFNDWYKELTKNLPEISIIYLYSHPKVILNRVKKIKNTNKNTNENTNENRNENTNENYNISLKYIENNHIYYEKWRDKEKNNNKWYTLNGNHIDIKIDNWINKIENQINDEIIKNDFIII